MQNNVEKWPPEILKNIRSVFSAFIDGFKAMNIQIFTLQVHGDDRGSLVALEQDKNIPFHIKRIYYMFATLADVRRGFHAHKNLRQVAIAVRGSCRFLLDDGNEKIELLLDNSSQALLIEPMVWHEMFEYSEDCVLLVLASEFYSSTDYIRDYNQFLNAVKINES